MDPAYFSELDALIKDLDRHIDEDEDNPSGLIRKAKGLESRARNILHGHARAEEVARYLNRGSAASASGVLREIQAAAQRASTTIP